jgi:hydroxyacylglutathione hydrolase
MYLKTFVAGPISTNAYLVADEEQNEALIVDAPPTVSADLRDALRRHGFRPVLIVLTHPHWDHILDAEALHTETGAPVAAHPDAVPQLEKPAPLMMPVGLQLSAVVPQRLLGDGEEIPVGRYRFRVVPTPGHAPGQISLYEPGQRIMFVGDTLFAGGYGRVDLPGSSIEETLRTMRRLLDLPDDVTVYPGHGHLTTIGAERPWMTQVVGAPSES